MCQITGLPVRFKHMAHSSVEYNHMRRSLANQMWNITTRVVRRLITCARQRVTEY